MRAPDQFTAGRRLTYTKSAAGKNKQSMEEEEGDLEDGMLDKGARRQVLRHPALVHSKSGACAMHALLLGNMR